jgi:putative membrane protein
MRIDRLFRQFNWRFLLVRILVNAIAVAITAAVTPRIYFVDKSVWSWLLIAVMLGVLNALLKPLLQFLTLRFIFVTYGLVIVLVNTVILLVLSFLFPTRFAVENLWWALLGGLVLGLLSSFLESLLGLTMPIVPEEEAALRRRLEKEARSIDWRAVTRREAEPAEQSLAIEPSAGAAEVTGVVTADSSAAEAPRAEDAAVEDAAAENAAAENAVAEDTASGITAAEGTVAEPPSPVADGKPGPSDGGASGEPEPTVEPGEEPTEETLS